MFHNAHACIHSFKLCTSFFVSAAGTVIGIILFIIISVFLFIVLSAVVYQKHYKKTVTRKDDTVIYDYIDISIPPQLPPSRLTIHDNPAYEKADSVSKQSQEIQ